MVFCILKTQDNFVFVHTSWINDFRNEHDGRLQREIDDCNARFSNNSFYPNFAKLREIHPSLSNFKHTGFWLLICIKNCYQSSLHIPLSKAETSMISLFTKCHFILYNSKHRTWWSYFYKFDKQTTDCVIYAPF